MILLFLHIQNILQDILLHKITYYHRNINQTQILKAKKGASLYLILKKYTRNESGKNKIQSNYGD